MSGDSVQIAPNNKKSSFFSLYDYCYCYYYYYYYLKITRNRSVGVQVHYPHYIERLFEQYTFLEEYECFWKLNNERIVVRINNRKCMPSPSFKKLDIKTR